MTVRAGLNGPIRAGLKRPFTAELKGPVSAGLKGPTLESSRKIKRTFLIASMYADVFTSALNAYHHIAIKLKRNHYPECRSCSILG